LEILMEVVTKGYFGALLHNKRVSNGRRKIFDGHSHCKSRTILGCV
jgi:hypothetical protein